jgi:hypothetical protein
MLVPQIPVLVVTQANAMPQLAPSDTLLRLPRNSGHGHADGTTCVACSAQTDVRALLYNLLLDRDSGTETFTRVIVDASAVSEPLQVMFALTGKLPAQALRDHTVAKRFYLQGVAGR